MNSPEPNVNRQHPHNLDLKRIWSSSQLPTLPSVAVKLLEVSKLPDTEVKDFVEVLKTDPALTAKVLRSQTRHLWTFVQSHVDGDGISPPGNDRCEFPGP